MRQNSFAFLGVFILLIVSFCIKAQTCKTGKLDPRVEAFLKILPPEQTLEQQRNTPIEQIRKFGPPITPYPQNNVKRIKITADSIPVLVFNTTNSKGLPVIIDYHGGGFMLPLLPWMEHDFWQDAKTYNAVVFAVDYRVAPEYKFPIAIQDAYNAFKWVTQHATEFGGDTSHIILMGGSAGGNCVAVVSQKAKKEGIAEKIKLQVMNCPGTDAHPENYASIKENATGYMATKASVLFALETYATPKDYNNLELAPILTANLSGLPPAVIFTAEFDPMRDEGAAYAERLRKAGVRIWYKCFPGQIHTLIGLPPDAAERKEMAEIVEDAIKEVVK